MDVGAVLTGASYALRAKEYYDNAKLAYKVGKGVYNFAKNNSTKKEMAHTKYGTPSTNRTKRRMSMSSSVLAKKRRLSSSSARKSSVSSVKSSVKVQQPIGQSSVALRHKKVKSGFKDKRKKTVRVSKKLRDKISKVMEQKKVYGSGRVLIHGGTQVPYYSGNTIFQTVFPLPIPQAGDTQKGLFFDNRFLMYVASRLFNGRLTDGGGITAGKYSDILLDSATGWANFSKALTTTPSAFKMNVTNLKAKITIKNNTGRTQYLKMYVCKPKYQRQDLTGSSLGIPAADWNNLINFDYQAKVKGEEAVSGTKASGINVPSTTSSQSTFIYSMYATPQQVLAWKRQWAYNEYSIVMEPGQVHQHWIQGDVGEYDFSKMYSQKPDGSFEFNNIQKTDRHVFFTNVPELASNSTGPRGGRLQNSNAGDLLLFETEVFCGVSLPETAGTAIDTTITGGLNIIQPLTQRKRAYFVDNYYDSSAQVNFTNNFDDNTTTRQTT